MVKKKDANSVKTGSRSALAKFIPVVVIFAVIVAAAIGMKSLNQPKQEVGFQKGMGYVTWSVDAYGNPSSDASVTELKELGVDWISVLVTWYQTNCWSGDIHRGANTPSDETIAHVIRKAHAQGQKVMLKVHLDLLDKSDGSWRGEIGSLTEADWGKWFQKYTEFVLYYSNIAQKENVEMYCVGTELSTAATVKGYMWKDIIKKVRGRYRGLLTYAAHWDRYSEIRFWDELDYVGINAYFPLTEKMVPTKEELTAAWVKWVNEIEDFQEKVGRPIIFPECGVSSADGSAIRPWEHVSRHEVNLALQKDYYEAIYEAFWGREWFYGMYWWYWGTNTNMGGKYNRGFTPQNKPAELVVKEWYAKPDPRK